MTRTVIVAVDDMFFASKIRATAEHLGVAVRFVRSSKALIDAALNDQASLIIVDLHSQKFTPIDLAGKLKAHDQLQSVSLVGFFSHVETELKRAAESAGYDHVLPRSVFTRDLPQILTGEF